MQIYLSYRHDETKMVAERINDHLMWRYRAGQVVGTITGTSLQDYTMLVQTAIAQSNVVLVVIGPHWLTASNPQGNHIINDPVDPIHIELALALASGKLVVPLLVHGATMPTAQELPPDLAALSLHQGLIVHPDPQFPEDMAMVYAQINTQLTWRPANPRMIIGGAVTLVMFLVVIFGSLIGGANLTVNSLSIITYASFILCFASLALTFVGALVLCLQRRQYLWLAGIVAPLIIEVPLIPVIDVISLFLTVPLYCGVIIFFGVFGKRREFA